MILMATFIIACQRYGKVTSGGMWLTWLLFSLCGLPELYYYLNLALQPSVSHSNLSSLSSLFALGSHVDRGSAFCCVHDLVSVCCDPDFPFLVC